MSVPFLNVVTGERLGALPSLLLPGQWQVVPDQRGGAAVQVHGRAVDKPFSPITPGARLDVQWTIPGGLAGHSLFESKLTPDDTTSGSVREIVRRLGSVASWTHSWKMLSQLSPVAPGVSDRAHVTTFERRLAQWLHHLEAVCARPRSQLTIESERVPVSRAKRIAAGAANFLAAHTEDWHHRTLRGVEPRRVLAVAMDDDLDTYENAVAARLVDQLLDHVSRRVEEVSRVHWLLEEAHNYSTQAGGTHWRQRRIYELWGEAFRGGDDVVRGEAGRTLAVLQDLRLRLLRLLDSKLYKAIPPQRVVPAALRMTNILTNDQHYKWIARMWLARREHLPVSASDPDDPGQLFRESVHDWTAYVGVLLLRVLAELGFEAVSGGEYFRMGAPPVQVSNGMRELRVSWSADGAITLCLSRDSSGTGRLRIVPLPVALSGGAEPATVERVLRDLGVVQAPDVADGGRTHRREHPHAAQGAEARSQTRSAQRGVVETLVVYPGVLQERARYEPELRWALQTLQNDSPIGPRGRVGLVPVSPLSIDSLERVGRALRWWLAARWTDTYPARLRLAREASDVVRRELSDVLSVESDGTLTFKRRLSRDEARRLEEALRRSAVASGGRPRDASPFASAAEQFQGWWQKSDTGLQELFACLICGTEARNHHVDVRANGQVACNCASCGSTWGIRACGECGVRFPYLLPKAASHLEGRGDPGWVDRVYGRDVLAIPCGEPELGAYLCPSCGARP